MVRYSAHMKRGVLGITLLLTISLLPAHSATPPKSGSTCTKQGATKTYQGKKYTCIKSGKKLIWDKGASIAKPIPSSSISPLPQASPSATETFSSPGNSEYSNAFSDPRILSAFENLRKTIENNPSIPTLSNLTFIVDPETPNPGEQLIKEKLKDSIRLYKSMDPKADIPVRIYIYNSKNFDELADLMRKDLTPEALEGGWLEAKTERAKYEWRGFFGGASPGYGKDGTPVLFYNLNSNDVATFVGIHVYTHEYVHVYQRYLLGNMQRMTCWMREGQATYLGFNLAAENSKDFVLSWKALYKYLTPNSDTTDFYTKTEEDWVKWMKSQELRPVTDCEGISNYVYGAIMWSYLYGQYGLEKTSQFFANVRKYPVALDTPLNAPGDSWKNAFFETYGVTAESEYPKIAKYFVQEAKWVKGWKG